MEGWRRKYDAGAISCWLTVCNILQVRRKFLLRRGDLTKAKFHYEAAALAGLDVARCNLGEIWNELLSIKPWTITASAGSFQAMHALIGQTPQVSNHFSIELDDESDLINESLFSTLVYITYNYEMWSCIIILNVSLPPPHQPGCQSIYNIHILNTCNARVTSNQPCSPGTWQWRYHCLVD
jgi:hypothetical protein